MLNALEANLENGECDRVEISARGIGSEKWAEGRCAREHISECGV